VTSPASATSDGSYQAPPHGLSGQDPGTLLAPAGALGVLALYAAAAAGLGSLATSRRDVT
jgi:hypothetical protein